MMEEGKRSMISVLVLVAGIVLCILIIGIIIYVRERVKGFSRLIFGTEDIAQGIKQREAQLQTTPKSVSGMTRLELPRIKKDFPEFDWPQWRQCCENQLIAYFEAIEHRDTGMLVDASEPLKTQARLRITEDEELGKEEMFNETKIHQTEIVRYLKRAGTCVIEIQSAVEYIHVLDGKSKKEQHRYNMELVYVQDTEIFGEGNQALGLNCPNCGAPVKGLEVKFCEYCGTGIEPLNIRVWELHKISE